MKFDEYLETLDDKSSEIGDDLESLKDSGGKAMDDIRTGIKEAWERLAIAKRAAKTRFN